MNSAPTEQRGWRFAVDRGGTFTDIVGFGPDGSLHTRKVLSRDPHHPGDPALRGIGELLAESGARLGTEIESVRLGTTAKVGFEYPGRIYAGAYQHSWKPSKTECSFSFLS